MQLYTNKELKMNKQCDTDDILLKREIKHGVSHIIIIPLSFIII
jgi:hypothetical protein